MMRDRWLLIAWIGVLLLPLTHAGSQVIIRGGKRPVILPQREQSESTVEGEDDESFTAHRFDVNADAEVLMTRARDSFRNDQAREALLMCQRVMDKYGRSLTTTDDRLYMPASRAVERLILEQSEEVLKLYRLNVDTTARALLDEPVDRSRNPAQLQQINERYFLSSLGDEAVYRLGCLRLDQGRYRAAAKLFRRVLEHPDLSPRAPAGASAVDRRELQWRLALCVARVGNMDEAASRLAELRRRAATDGRGPLISGLLEQRRRRLVVDAEPDRWPHSQAAIQGVGVMAGLGESGHKQSGEGWAVLWDRKYSMRLPNYTQPTRTSHSQNISRHQLIQWWQSSGWIPAVRLIFHGDRLWLRSHDGLLCLDTATGRTAWPQPYRQPGDAVNATLRFSYYSSGMRTLPLHPQAVFAFADSAVRSLSWIDGTVYCIEGTPMVQTPDAMTRSSSDRLTNYGLSQALAALDAETGKFKWRTYLGTDTKHTGQRIGARVLNAPVRVADRLFVTFSEQGQLFAALLDPQTGKPVVDPIYLIRLPTGDASWSPLGVLAWDDRVYLTDGRGVVLSIDVGAGRVEWARMWPRDSSSARPQMTRQRGRFIVPGGMQALAEDLSHIVMFQFDGYLVVSDAQNHSIYQVDISSGRLRRRTGNDKPLRIETEAFRYALGVHQGKLILADKKRLTAYDLRDGNIAWRANVTHATGRAALTENAIYVPADDHILRIDPHNGLRQSRNPLLVPLDQPLGNLYSDGRRLFSAGMDRVIALVDTDVYEQALTARFMDGDDSALLERAVLRRQQGRLDDAMADLRLAQRRIDDDDAERVKREMVELLMSGLDRLSLDDALARLDEAEQIAPSTDLRMRVLMAGARRLIDADRRQQAAVLCLKIIQLGGSTMIDTDDSQGHWSVRADQWAADRLRWLGNGVAPVTIDGSALDVRQGLDRALREEDPQRLYDLALLLSGSPMGSEAMQALSGLVQSGALNIKGARDRFEWAEALLLELTRDNRSRVADEALAELADLYHRVGWHTRASQCWRQLLALTDERMLERDGLPLPARELARQRLEETGLLEAPVTHALRPPLKRWWKMSSAGNQPLLMPGWTFGEDPFFDNHLLTYSAGFNRLELHRLARKRQRVWSLGLPDTLRLYPRRSSSFQMLSGGTDGHMLVIRRGSWLLGVGAISGQLRWQSQVDRLADERVPTPPDLAQRLNYPFAVGHGIVAETVDDEDGLSDLLRVAESLTGRELWRRALPDGLVQHLHIASRFVVAFHNNATHVSLFDRRSGRRLGGYSLEQSMLNNQALLTDEYMVYHVGGNLVCRRLQTGQILWTIAGSGIRRLQALGDRHIAVVWSSNMQFERIDPETGIKDNWKAFPDMVGKFVYDVAVSPDDRHIYTFGRFLDSTWALVRTNAYNGKRDLSIPTGRYANYRIALRDLARCGPVLPLVLRENDSSNYRLRFYDRDRGGAPLKDITLPFQDDGSDTIAALSSPPLIRNGKILIHAGNELHLFGPAEEPQPEPSIEKPSTPPQRTDAP